MPAEIYPSSPRRDLIGAVVWTALGCFITVLSWQMDRMTQQGATLHRRWPPGTSEPAPCWEVS
jgi:hypothetical protein